MNRDAALGVAIHRAQLRALISPPNAYVADYGNRPAADHPHQPIWDSAVTARAHHDLFGRGTGALVNDPQLAKIHGEARAAMLDRLPLQELVDRLTGAALAPTESVELDNAIERRVARAVANPQGYITDVLGSRPDDPNLAATWDQDATTVERARHRNGLERTAGHAGLGAAEVLGARVAKQQEVEHKSPAAEVVLEPNQPRRGGPSLRR